MRLWVREATTGPKKPQWKDLSCSEQESHAVSCQPNPCES